MGRTSKILRDQQNFGQGRSLQADQTCEKIAKLVAETNGRGSATEDKIVAALHNFREFLADQGIKTLERVDQPMLETYARTLSTQLAANGISPSTAAGRISALNSVFERDPAARGIHISAAEFNISRGDRISRWDKSYGDKTTQRIIDALKSEFQKSQDIRYLSVAAAISLQRAGGLRFEESCKIDLPGKDFSRGIVSLDEHGDGTKNGQARSFTPVGNGIAAFREAQAFQKAAENQLDRGSLIPGSMT